MPFVKWKELTEVWVEPGLRTRISNLTKKGLFLRSCSVGEETQLKRL